MIASEAHLRRRTGWYGTPRFEYLQALVKEFQASTDPKAQLQIVCNLGNFAYDPINYRAFHRLHIIDLFLDCLVEDQEALVLAALSGLANCAADRVVQQQIEEADGVDEIIACFLHEGRGPAALTSAMMCLMDLLAHPTLGIKILGNSAVKERIRGLLGDEAGNEGGEEEEVEPEWQVMRRLATLLWEDLEFREVEGGEESDSSADSCPPGLEPPRPPQGQPP